MIGRSHLAAGGAAALLSAWTMASGCAADEQPPPEPTPVVDAGPDVGTDSGTGGATPIRTVEYRNPYGNVAKVDNLLWDGDFEWVYPYADQSPWFVGQGSYLTGYLEAEQLLYGAQCRSGIKCAELGQNRLFAGMAVSSQGHSLSASFWAKPSAGDCDTIEATLLPESYSEYPADLAPESSSPDGAGWCRFSATASEKYSSLLLLIRNGGEGPAIIDDAVIEPVAPAAKQRSAPRISPERRAELNRLIDQARELRKPNDHPPNPHRERMERSMKRIRPHRAVQH